MSEPEIKGKAIPFDANTWKDYLRAKTGSAKCPYCGHEEWEIQPENRVLGNDFVFELNAAVSGKKVDFPRPRSVLQHLFIVECRHCGFVSLFNLEKFGDFLNGKK